MKTVHSKQGNITIPHTFMLRIGASLAYRPYQKKTADIESIKKNAMEIILQENYSGYDLACNIFSTQTIKTRRTKLCYKYASKNMKSDHSFLNKIGTTVKTRHKSDIVKEFKCNFGIFSNSSQPYLARLSESTCNL